MKSKYLAESYRSELLSRRRFLRQAACAVAGTTAMSNVLRDFRFMNAAVAQSVITDYKALICVFLNGGNDSNNMIIPTIPSEWTSYAAIRNSGVPNLLAIPNTDGGPATALKLKNPTAGGGTGTYQDSAGHTYGFHPAMKELGGDYTSSGTISTTPGLFNTGKCAVLLNVGSLAYPITKAQYFANSVPVPPQLFSHQDQQTQWQTSIPDQPPTSGWAGRIADLMTAPGGNLSNGVNGNPSKISMAVTLAGSNIFEVGSNNYAPQYSVSTNGVVQLSTGITGARSTSFTNIISGDVASADLQTSAYANVLSSALTEASTVSNALTAIGSPSYLTRFPTQVTTPNGGSTFTSSLMAQMKMVAQLIHIGKLPVTSGGLGMKRQIFFIQVGGYDTHTVQTQSSATNNPTAANVIIGTQAQLLAELSQTLNALYLAMGDLGTLIGDTNMQNNVTAFTVSDFTRTFPCNGTGTDHGWGGHHLIVGGAVNGGATYGTLPTLTVNGPNDTGTGRWIPTTSVDQYAATLATWYGVDPGNLSTVFPNLGRFVTPNLGFMGAPG